MSEKKADPENKNNLGGETKEEEFIDSFFSSDDKNNETSENKEEETKVVIDKLKEATGREFKDIDDVAKWAKNITKYVGANENSRGAKEAKEFQEKTGMTPTEFLEQSNVVERLDEIEIAQKRPDIMPVINEARALAKEQGISIEEAFDKSKVLQQASKSIIKEEELKNNITQPNNKIKIGKKTLDDMSLDELKQNFSSIKDRILSKS